MSGAHSSADAAQPGRRVRAGVAITFHGPASAWARPMLRFGAVAAPTYPTRDSTTVGSANERDHISGAGIPLVRWAAPAGDGSLIAIGARTANAPSRATRGTTSEERGGRGVRDMRSSLTSVGAGHGHGHAAGRAADRGRLRLVLAITAVVLVVELVADAGHLATDAAAVVLALGASYVAAMPGGPRSTFGYHRAEILAAMANAVVLLVVCGYLAWAGLNRLRSPGDVEVDAGLLIAFATVGLLANAVSLNLRGAALEVTADLVGSGLALGAGVVIALTGWVQADAVASLLIALLILPRSWSLLKESSAVLLEIAPAGLDLDDVRRHVAAMPGVIEVHDLHAWTITSGIPSLSAHVTVTDEALAEHGVGGILDRLCECVATHFEVRHATFQVEPVSHRSHEDLGDLHA